MRIGGLATGPWLPLVVAARRSLRISRVVADWSQRIPFGRVHVEWSQIGQYLPPLAGIPRRTLYVHDVLTQWAQRKAENGNAFWRWEKGRTQRWEAATYRSCTRLYAPSRKDVGLVEQLAPEVRDRITVLPLHFDNYAPNSPRDLKAPLRLLFWGALGREENAEAARWLAKSLVPELQKRGRSATLVLAGSNPPPDLVALNGGGIEVTGFIDDPRPVFAGCQAAILPLFQGAGVKVKVLECLAAGLPVLTTSIGAEGIEAQEADGLISLDPQPGQFAQLITELDQDRTRLANLGEGALAWGRRQNRDLQSLLVND